jgi:choline monooxygenase
MNDELRHHLKNTIYESRALPGSFFTSEEVLRAEKKYFFRDSWLCVGLVNDVPESGDVYPLTIVDQPLLIVHDKGSTIRVFHNVCSHRGAQLIEKNRRCTTIVCPYHAWSYALDGELIQTPHVGGENIHECAEINKAELGLKEVRSGIWAGLVFVNLSSEAGSFEDFIEPLNSRWQEIDFSALEHVKELGQRPQFNANWKLVIENFIESYHLPSVHQSMNSFNPMGDHYQILGGESFIGQGVKGHKPGDGYAGKFLTFPNLNPDEYGNGESMYLPGNLIIICMSDFFFVNIVTPVSPTVTTERIEIFLIGDSATDPELQKDRQQLMDMLCLVNNEDIAICESVQRGRSSDAFSGGAFAPIQETTTLHFQKLLAREILSRTDTSLTNLPVLAVEDIHHPE